MALDGVGTRDSLLGLTTATVTPRGPTWVYLVSFSKKCCVEPPPAPCRPHVGQLPRCGGVTECGRNVPLHATGDPHPAIGAATPRLGGTSPGDRVPRSGSRPRRAHSRSSRRDPCWYPPGNSVCDLHAKDRAPSIGRR